MSNCVLSPATLANDVTQEDFDEWVKDSGVCEVLARLNPKSIEDPVEIALHLYWQKYLGTGGWYVLSCDPLTGFRGKYGQFKPKEPIQFPDNEKPQKYFTFPKDAESVARIEAKVGGQG